VPLFLVESSVSTDPDAFDSACDGAQRTAATDERVTHVRSTFLPGGGVVLHLFDAPSEETLEAAGRRAGLELRRIVETVADTPT
jgi:hypothetical protein